MRLNCEIKSTEIIPNDECRSLAFMSRKTSAFATIIKEEGGGNIHVAINPDQGFIMSFECGLDGAPFIFVKIKKEALS